MSERKDQIIRIIIEIPLVDFNISKTSNPVAEVYIIRIISDAINNNVPIFLRDPNTDEIRPILSIDNGNITLG